MTAVKSICTIPRLRFNELVKESSAVKIAFKSGTLAILTVVDVLIAADPLALMLALNSVGIANKANLSSPLTLTEAFNPPFPLIEKVTGRFVTLPGQGALAEVPLVLALVKLLKISTSNTFTAASASLVVVNRYKLTKLMLVNKKIN